MTINEKADFAIDIIARIPNPDHEDEAYIAELLGLIDYIEDFIAQKEPYLE